MSGMAVDMKSKGDEQAALLLAGLAKRGEDARPALRQISNELRAAEDPWFASHGNGTWLPLADITREDKAAHGYPPATLVRTGLLGASLTVRSGSRSIRRTTKDAMHFGSSVYYAKFHAIGGNVPPRDPLIPVDRRTRERMVLDVKRFVLTGKTTGPSL